MRHTRSLTLACAASTVLTAAACSPEPVLIVDDGRIDLAATVDDGATLMGVSTDPITGRRHVLVEGRGILEFSDDGALTNTLAVNERGLRDLPYRDLASLGDGRFLLIADNEGYLFDAVTEQHRVHFCVEPGFVECFDDNGELIDTNNNGVCDWDEAQPDPGPEPLLVVQRNDALGLMGNEVVAAPRFYEQGTRIEASLRSYDASTGVATGAVDLSAIDLELTGLAPQGGGLVGVGGDGLVRFGTDGVPGDRFTLAGVSAAAGVIADGDGVLVLDQASRSLVRFGLGGR